MSRGPLRKIAADICDEATDALRRHALTLALRQEGTYDTSDPPRLLARLIEDAFAGYRPTVEQIDRVRVAVERDRLATAFADALTEAEARKETP